MNQLSTKKMSQLLKKRKKGFTLVELIIVIAIIAILVALAIPKFGEIIENTNKKADQATAKNIATIVAQQIADGQKLTTAEVKDGDTTVYNKLDGNKLPKAKAANGSDTFTYTVGDDGNIKVSYTKSNQEVYPTYSATISTSTSKTPATPAS